MICIWHVPDVMLHQMLNRYINFVQMYTNLLYMRACVYKPYIIIIYIKTVTFGCIFLLNCIIVLVFCFVFTIVFKLHIYIYKVCKLSEFVIIYI